MIPPTPEGAVPASGERARRGDPVALSRISYALLLLVLLLAGAAIARANLRVDLTGDKLYTLSDATKRVLKTLSDPAKIEVYWGKNVPASASPAERRLHGLLDEYETRSDGRLTVEWVTMDDAGEKRAAERGIPEITFRDLSANQISQVKARLGLAVLLGGKTEVIAGLIDDTENQYNLPSDTEFQLTSVLWKLSRTTQRGVGVVAAQPRMSFMNPHGGGNRFSVLTGPSVLQRFYGDQLKPYLALEDAVPQDVKVLLVLGPSELGEKQAYHLEQFLLRGGKVLLALDPVSTDAAWGGGQPTKSGLEEWLKALGVETPEGVVADYAKGAQSFAVTQDGQGIPYPYWPRALADDFDPKNPALQGLDQVTFYWPAEIVVDAAKQTAAGRKTTVLATTTDAGYRRPDLTGLMRPDGPQGKTLGKKTLLIALEGKFESHWKGKAAPDEPPPPPAMSDEPAMGEAPAMGEEPAMGEAPAMGETPPAMEEAPPAMNPEPAPSPAEGPPAPAPAEPPVPAPAPGMEAPPAPSMGETPPPAPGSKGPEGEGGDKGPPKPQRLDEGTGMLLILTDADLVSDEFSGVRGKDITGGVTSVINYPMGFVMVPNLVDWLSGDEEIIALRSRGAKPRKFDEIKDEDANAIKWVNHLAAPVLVLIAGFLVYFVRRYRS